MRACTRTATLIALFSVMIISSTVHAAWVADGISVCLPIGQQDQPVVAPDGSGGVFVVWRDSRTVVNTDIYVQRIDADGNILLLNTGMPVCTAANLQSTPFIVSDGAGGAIVAWQDFRSGSTNDIYVQRIDSFGFIQWTADGVAACTGQTGLVIGRMIPDGAGGAIIAWHDRRDFTNGVFAQRVSPAGIMMWTGNGVVVSSETGHQQNPSLASDGAGGAIIAWEDARNGANDIYAQKLDGTGTAMWASNGIAVCNAADTQIRPRVIPDGIGGAIVSWSDHRNTVFFGIYAQRLSSSGGARWTADGMTISSVMYDQIYCQIVPVGSGEAVVMWEDERNGANTWDIYAQKVDTTGAVSWTANGIAICTATGNQTDLQLVTDNEGGAVVVWEDERNGAANVDIYAQRIYSDGALHWTADGEAVCTAAGNQSAPQIASDGWSGAHVAWKDPRSGTTYVYAQRIDGAGNTVVATLLQSYSAAWNDKGVRIEWTLSEIDEGADFIVSRAAGLSMDFSEIPSGGMTREDLSFSFIDTGCEPGTTYYYRVELASDTGRLLLFETGPVETPPAATTLYQNHPNPFNPSTTIRYQVPERCRVTLDVYSVSGDLVARLYDGYRERGAYTASWNGCDAKGAQMSSGVYLYRLRAGKETLSRKMILLR
jgi:hypothetical protein